jgi:hypothetical protein
MKIKYFILTEHTPHPSYPIEITLLIRFTVIDFYVLYLMCLYTSFVDVIH